MTTSQQFTRRDDLEDFPQANPFNLAIFRGETSTLVPAPVVNLRGSTVEAVWSVDPPDGVVAAYQALRDAHFGGATSSAPQQFQQLGNVDAPNQGVFVDVLNVQTPPVEDGTYLVLVATELCMPAVVANTAIRAEFAVQVNSSPEVVVGRTTVPSTLAAQSGGYDPHAMLALSAGQRLRAILRIARLGASAATARAFNSRISIAKQS